MICTFDTGESTISPRNAPKSPVYSGLFSASFCTETRARTVAVVVPSPATSLVLLATSNWQKLGSKQITVTNMLIWSKHTQKKKCTIAFPVLGLCCFQCLEKHTKNIQTRYTQQLLLGVNLPPGTNKLPKR